MWDRLLPEFGALLCRFFPLQFLLEYIAKDHLTLRKKINAVQKLNKCISVCFTALKLFDPKLA